LYDAFHSSRPGNPIKICGLAIDKIYTLSRTHTHDNSTETAIVSGEERELGLGLKIVKKIIDIYDGGLASYHDTTVRITLPVEQLAGFNN
jgi:signal transduction histidine kinase